MLKSAGFLACSAYPLTQQPKNVARNFSTILGCIFACGVTLTQRTTNENAVVGKGIRNCPGGGICAVRHAHLNHNDRLSPF